MCRTFSGFTTEKELLYFAPEASDSHEFIADLLGITREPQRRVQWEFYPPSDEWDQPEKYELHTDQDIIPEWWDTERQEAVADALRQRIARMIRRDTVKALASGPWILADGFKAERTSNAVIVATCGKVALGAVAGSVAIRNINGTLTTGDVGGTLTTGDVYKSGTLTTGNVGGTLTTGYVDGTLTTGYVGGTLTTGDVYKSGTLTTGDVYKSGTLTTGYVDGTLTTGDVGGTLTTGYVYKSGTLTTGNVGGCATVSNTARAALARNAKAP